MGRLLVDIGNTRTKSAIAGDDGFVSLAPFATGDRAALGRWCERLGDETSFDRVLVSSVGAADFTTAVEEALERRCVTAVERVCVADRFDDFTTAYDDPAQLGVDRWLAALAAWRDRRGAVCVIDAGTATTADVVDAGGRHLGGLIAPGLALMADSLTRNTAQLVAGALEPGAGLATNTADAIALGCTESARGLVSVLAERLAGDPATRDLTWYLTGGAAPQLAALVPLPWQHDPELVLRGLAAVGSG